MIYHWSNKDKLENDSEYLTNLYERYLIYLSDILNKFHSLKKDTKYWRIIIGPWLRFFIDIAFDRYETLKLKGLNLSHKNKHHAKNYIYLRDNDFDSFFKNCYTDKWNDNLLNLIQGLDPFENPYKQKIKKRKIIFTKSFIKNLYIILINPINRKFNKHGKLSFFCDYEIHSSRGSPCNYASGTIGYEILSFIRFTCCYSRCFQCIKGKIFWEIGY